MFQPGDLIVLKSRTWRVTSNCLGALGQESVVGLAPLDMKGAYDTVIVPRDMLNALLETKSAKLYKEIDNREII